MRAATRRWLAGTAAALSLSGMLNVAAAGPAAAYGTCSVNVPARLTVDAPFKRFTASLASDCDASGADYATWDIRHHYYGPQNLLIFDGNTTDTWDFYDWGYLGTHYVEPSSSWDHNYNDLAQNTRTVSVRLGSRLYIASSRSGAYVTLHTTLKRYRPSADGFAAWPNHPVRLQFQTCATCAWTTFKTVYPNSYGKAAHRFYSARGKNYRAVAADMSTTWGRTSATTYR